MSSRAENSPFTLPGYDILEKLGEGGMGVVFKARDKKLERQVAIKFLYQDGDVSKDTNQLLQEARRLAQVNHPNVVSIYELCETQTETQKRSAIVMEFLNGTPLSDIHKEQLLPQNQKLSYLIQIAQGMVAIHDAGLRHSDLKAENVWITNDNKVKLLDFGLSAEIDANHKEPEPASSDYSSASLTTLSPEFCRGEQLTQQSDIFNFGCLACRLFTDKLPFETTNLEDTQNALRNGKIAKVSHLSPALSVALAQVLDHCLMAEPKERPVSFAQVLKQLLAIEDAFQKQQLANNVTMAFEPVAPVAGSNVTSTNQPGLSTEKRNKLLVAIASTVLLITLTVFIWHQNNQPPPEQSVLVFPAKMTGDAEMPPEQTRMIKAALDNTLRDAVINTQSLNLISRSELDSVADDLNSRLKATGASSALQPLVDCQDASCQFTVELIDGDSALIQNQVRWHSNVLDVYEISTVAQSHFQQLFPDYPVTDGDVIPVSKEAYEEFARLYAELQFNAGNTEVHLAELGELLKANPYLFSGYRLYREVATKLYNDTKDLNYLSVLEEVLLNSPIEYKKSNLFTWNLILLKLEQKDYESVETLMDSAIKQGIDNIAMINLKGIYYFKSGKYLNAKEHFKKSLKSRFSAYALYNLSLTNWYLGEIGQGIQNLNTLLDILPSYYKGIQLLASMHLTKGEASEAIEYYERMIAEYPEHTDLSNMGLAYLLQGNLKKAHEVTEKAFNLSPNNLIFMLNLADIEILSGLTEVATKRYKLIAIRLDKANDVDSLLIKAQAQTHLGNYIEATKTLVLASKLSPESSEVAFISSLVFTLSGQYPAAIAKMEEALVAGIGVAWFSLPWFSKLCMIEEASEILNQYYISGEFPCA